MIIVRARQSGRMRLAMNRRPTPTKTASAFAAALAVLSCAGPARAWLFGRDKVSSRWASAKLPVNGDDSDWDASAAFETGGMSVSARNDAEDLYLIVTAHTRDRRDQLVGEAREDLFLWFLGPDGRKRQWGALLPFSRRASLEAALEGPAGADPAPELALAGPSLSTAAWPSELAARLAPSARRPVLELRVPLRRLAVLKEGEVRVDVVVAENPGLPRGRHAAPRVKGSYGEPPLLGTPEPVELNLSVRLARRPEAGR